MVDLESRDRGSELTELERLFNAAVMLGEKHRSLFLDAACLDRPELRATLQQLISYDKSPHRIDELDFSHVSSQLFNTSSSHYEASTTADDKWSTVDAARRIGPYELVDLIGEGGMGAVWRARQLSPIQREVAIKLIRRGFDSSSIKRRFESERQSLAEMNHPHIARLLDAGETENGQPFFVMELVRGVSITRYCEDAELTIRERLELFLQVCSAVNHAHQKLTIHRDLKPDNILVTEVDGLPVCKVIDFGLAKALQEAPWGVNQTGFHTVMGTPLYMSPEQIGPSSGGADTRSDQYALGIILYELLTGSPTISRERVKRVSFDELREIICSEEPPCPSTLAASSQKTIALEDSQSVGRGPSEANRKAWERQRWVTTLRGELDWIVMKTLEKQPSRRYESVSGLARDIERFLNDEPVEASPASKWYRFRKFTSRYRWQFMAAQVMLVTLVAGIIGTTWGLLHAESQRRLAETASRQSAESAERARLASLEANRQRMVAEEAELATLESYRASMDDAIEKLILSKGNLTIQERLYLEKALERWEAFANRKGEDEHSLAISAEGHFHAANIWDELGDATRSLAEYEQAVALSEQLATGPDDDGRYRYMAARYRRNLSNELEKLGRTTEAQEQLRQSNTIAETLVALVADNPRYVQEWSRGLEQHADLLRRRGEYPQAEVLFRKAEAIQVALVNDHPEVHEYRLSLGLVLLKYANFKNDLNHEDTEATFQRSLDAFEKLAQADPSVILHRAGLATVLSDYGDYLAAKGLHAEAENMLRRAVEVHKALVADYPAPDKKAGLAWSHQALGVFLRDQLSNAEAGIAELRTAVAIQQELTTDFPNNVRFRMALADIRRILGFQLYKYGNLEEARDEYLKALREYEHLAEMEPYNRRVKLEIGIRCYDLGELEFAANQQEASFDYYSRAIITIEPICNANPNLEYASRPLRDSYAGRARVRSKLSHESASVEADWEAAFTLDSKRDDPASRVYRVGMLLDAGRVDKAISELEALSGLKHWNRIELYDLGWSYAKLHAKSEGTETGYADRAVKFLKRAVDAGFVELNYIRNDKGLDVLREREDFKQLIEQLEDLQQSEHASR